MPYTNIDRSSDNFRVKLYTGNGSTQSITFDESNSMQPDLTWIRVRNDTNAIIVHDVIRGATKELYSTSASGEATSANGLTSFNSNGFSVGLDFGVNRNGYNLVNWSWKANGAGVSNTAGTLTSTVSANTTAGFSIVSYTATSGASSIGHGLGVAPKMIILKGRGLSASWVIGLSVNGWNKYLLLDSSQANVTDRRMFSPTAGTDPTSTLFWSDQSAIGSAGTMIAYCFADVKGYSKFGSYKGNVSSDGTFVYTGFKPAYLMIKNVDQGAGYGFWTIWDNKRNTYNPEINYLIANATDAESTGDPGGVDFLSNGFKIRNAYDYSNGSGINYVYMCFAENPFVSSKGIPTTAR